MVNLLNAISNDGSTTIFDMDNIKSRMNIGVADITDFTATMAGYATAAALTTVSAMFTNYATIASLSSYELTSALTTLLSSYQTITAFNVSIANYVTTTALTTALSPYALISQLPATPVFNNAPSSPPLVTTIAAANGAVLSSTRDCDVNYAFDLSCTSTIAGSSNIVVVLEINPSSSATTGWVAIDKIGDGQAFSLAIALQGVQTISHSLKGKVPAGYSHRARQVITGTASATYAAGQTILR